LKAAARRRPRADKADGESAVLGRARYRPRCKDVSTRAWK